MPPAPIVEKENVTIILSANSREDPSIKPSKLLDPQPADLVLKKVLPGLNKIFKDKSDIPAVILARNGLVQAIIFAHEHKCHLQISPEDLHHACNFQTQRVPNLEGGTHESQKGIEFNMNVDKEFGATPPGRETACGIQTVTLLGSENEYKKIEDIILVHYNFENDRKRSIRPEVQTDSGHSPARHEYLWYLLQVATFIRRSFRQEKNDHWIAMWRELIWTGDNESYSGWFTSFIHFDDTGRALEGIFRLRPEGSVATAGNDSAGAASVGPSKPNTNEGFQKRILRSACIAKITSQISNKLPVGYVNYNEENMDQKDGEDEEEEDDEEDVKEDVKEDVEEDVDDTASDKTVVSTALRGSPAVAFLWTDPLQGATDHDKSSKMYNTVKPFSGHFRF